ncbi:hypothetical protein [Yoonia sp. F2084L]|uniref:hypothetical protein n=1 Tax=Yoonia sp. F2084L TaxID=2926419 RepID=UPI001FF0F916|nr:hypothetical protein [Yoonia sp. F2084L]
MSVEEFSALRFPKRDLIHSIIALSQRPQMVTVIANKQLLTPLRKLTLKRLL